MRLRAVAAISLSGRHAAVGRQAAAGLEAWAGAAGARLRVEDDRSDPAETARLYGQLASGADIVFGPYGSGAARAAARALAGSPAPVWNHGGAALERPVGARFIDVLGPAEQYWRGLPHALRHDGVDLRGVAIVCADSGFGRATAEGARRALQEAGTEPLAVIALGERSPEAASEAALRTGPSCVVGCCSIDDELALGRRLAGAGPAVGLVVCGVGLAAQRLGAAIAGWLGPSQWWPGGSPPPVDLGPGADYPAAQALAAGLVAQQALELAGSSAPEAVWQAALGLRTSTFLGPFAVDGDGRQTAHAPALVRWVRRRGRLLREVAWLPDGAPMRA